MKVRDIMVREIKTLSEDMTAKEAMDILIERRMSGMPVLDKNGKLIGIFTERHILTYILPSYLDKVGAFIYHEDSKAVRNKFAELNDIKVCQLMYKEVHTIPEDTALVEVARVMLIRNTRRLMVVDNSGALVGVVARCDIFKAFLKEIEQA